MEIKAVSFFVAHVVISQSLRLPITHRRHARPRLPAQDDDANWIATTFFDAPSATWHQKWGEGGRVRTMLHSVMAIPVS